MKKLRDLKGMPILSLQEGERLGQVRDLIVDPAAAQVVALVLDRHTSGGEHQVVATANIRNVGDAAITVEDRSIMVPLSRIPRFKELARTRKPIRGKMVITESGTQLGEIADLLVDPQTFHIVAFQLKGFLKQGPSIPAERVRTIGADVVVVRDEPAAGAEVVQPAPAPTVAPPPVEVPPEPEPTLELEPALSPTVAAPPVEVPVEPEPALELEPEPEPALELEPEPLPLPPDEAGPVPPEEGIEREVEPAVPSVSVLPETGPPPPEDAKDLPPADEEISPPTSAEPPVEEPGEQATENPWQRWVRRLRRQEEG